MKKMLSNVLSVQNRL